MYELYTNDFYTDKVYYKRNAFLNAKYRQLATITNEEMKKEKRPLEEIVLDYLPGIEKDKTISLENSFKEGGVLEDEYKNAEEFKESVEYNADLVDRYSLPDIDVYYTNKNTRILIGVINPELEFDTFDFGGYWKVKAKKAREISYDAIDAAINDGRISKEEVKNRDIEYIYHNLIPSSELNLTKEGKMSYDEYYEDIFTILNEKENMLKFPPQIKACLSNQLEKCFVKNISNAFYEFLHKEHKDKYIEINNKELCEKIVAELIKDEKIISKQYDSLIQLNGENIAMLNYPFYIENIDIENTDRYKNTICDISDIYEAVRVWVKNEFINLDFEKLYIKYIENEKAANYHEEDIAEDETLDTR